MMTGRFMDHYIENFAVSSFSPTPNWSNILISLDEAPIHWSIFSFIVKKILLRLTNPTQREHSTFMLQVKKTSAVPAVPSQSFWFYLVHIITILEEPKPPMPQTFSPMYKHYKMDKNNQDFIAIVHEL